MGKRREGLRAINLAQPFLCCVVLLLGMLGLGKAMAAPPHAAQSAKPLAAIRQAKKVLPAAIDTRPSCTLKPCIALTFDDGPDPLLTPQILDVLARHKARATFFVLGVHARGNEGLIKRIYTEGHEIGNHSWGHPNLTTLNPEQIRQQVYNTQAVVTAAHVPAPRLFRPPYGAVNDMVRSNVPLTIVQWNIDPEDWYAKKTTQQIVDHISTHAKPGAVIIMHDTHTRTLEALDPTLTNLERTYQLVTVSDLLNLAPGQSGMYYGR